MVVAARRQTAAFIQFAALCRDAATPQLDSAKVAPWPRRASRRARRMNWASDIVRIVAADENRLKREVAE
ncbi:MAG TPA: hypothetical protein DCQ92_19350 [Verrucomicrobia subdivision 3 bacterium]|nr:hypothetical protein [Limisphaerales bacterium]